MNKQVLSDEQIEAVRKKCADQFLATLLDEGHARQDPITFARSVIATYEAELAKQEKPVVTLEITQRGNMRTVMTRYDDYVQGCPSGEYKLYTHPSHSDAVALKAENEQLRKALRFYAAGWHFDLSDASAWDTVSGEPQNFWCDEEGTATVEDGSIAKMALKGVPINWTADGPEPPVVDGEKIDAVLAGQE